MAMQTRRLAKLGFALLGCGAILAAARPAAAGLLAQERPAMALWTVPPDPLAPPPEGLKQFDRLMIGVFVRSTTGRLVARRWGGTSWNWVDHGLPPKTSLACAPAVVAWRSGSSLTGSLLQISVMACGADGTLVERRFNGYSWVWVRHEAPKGAAVKSPGAVVQWKDGGGLNRLSFFFVGTDGNLHERFLNGSSWGWTNHATRVSSFQQDEAPAVVTWEPGRSPLSVFLRDDIGDLTERRLTGGNWEWKHYPLFVGAWELSLPLNSASAALAWRPPSASVRLQVFAVGADDHLLEFWGDDKSLELKDHGLSPSPTPWLGFAAAAWGSGSMSIRMSLFGRDTDGSLINRWFDGATWHWSDHGKPASTSLGKAAPTIITWKAGAVTRLNLFAVGLDGSLVEYWWNGQQWSWTEHKFPPF